MATIRNLIFDLGGVIALLQPEEAWRRFERLGVERVRERMGVYGQTGVFRAVEDGSLTDTDFCAQLGCTWDEAQWAWMGYVASVPQDRLDCLLRLRAQGYRTFLLSNTNPFIMQWAESAGFSAARQPIGHYFDGVYCSFRLKAYKPEAAIFQKMLRESGCKPEESLFLDDGPRNVEAAEAVGMGGLVVPKNADWIPMLTPYLNL